MMTQIKKYVTSVITDKTRKSSFLNFVIKPFSVVLGLIYTPILLKYLGDEKYGLWSTILSIISWINYCDVGIGQGLRNILSKEIAEDHREKIKSLVSTAFIILTLISSTLLIVGIISSFWLDWFKIFNTKEKMQAPMIISMVFICINFVLSLSNSIFYALQMSHRVAIRNCIIQIFNIIGVVFLSKVSNGNLVYLSFLFGITSSIVYIISMVQIFKNHSYIRISISAFRKDNVMEISNTGIKFFIIQLSCIALYTVDNLLISNLFGSAAVTPFNITYRIFNTAYAFLLAICVPYWSKTTEALAKKDFKWIETSIGHLYKIAGLAICGYVFLAIIFKPLSYIWLRRELEYPQGLIGVMCLYYCLYSIVTVNVQIINGTGEINFQLILMIIMGAANIPLSILLAKNFSLGVVGIRLATTILMAIGTVAFPVNLNNILKKIKNK